MLVVAVKQLVSDMDDALGWTSLSSRTIFGSAYLIMKLVPSHTFLIVFACLKSPLCQNWYSLGKTLAELEAFDYAKTTGLDVVSVCPSLVIGPLLQSTVNASSSVIVDCLKG